MTKNEILGQLKELGLDSIKKVLLKHGIKEPLYGVKVEELKKIQKKVKYNHALALELYASGVYDAMYLAGLIAEPEKMTKADLQHWAEKSTAPALSEYTVAWVASESRYGMEMAQVWIDSNDEGIASSGWTTLANIVAIKEDSDLDIPQLKQLLDRVVKNIHTSRNRVKMAMNAFVIACGTYVKELNDYAKQAGAAIGKVNVDMGDTACKVPSSLEYIAKAEGKNAIGKKRKSARC